MSIEVVNPKQKYIHQMIISDNHINIKIKIINKIKLIMNNIKIKNTPKITINILILLNNSIILHYLIRKRKNNHFYNLLPIMIVCLK